MIIVLFQAQVKGEHVQGPDERSRLVELERLRRERSELEEQKERAEEEARSLRHRLLQAEEEAARERAQAEADMKQVRERLIKMQEEADKSAKDSEVNIAVDPKLVVDADDSGTEDLFADIDIPSLMEFFDHEEVVENFLPDLFDSC